MPHSPPTVTALLSAEGEDARVAAWSEFLQEFSPALLTVARTVASGEDEAMDHYAFVADKLREEDFRRLRAYGTNGTAEFRTWLGVISKRLCVDNHRRRVGRPQAKSERSARQQAEWEARRSLAALVVADVDVRTIPDASHTSADDEMWKAQRAEFLTSAIGELTDADQLLLTLRFQDDFPLDAIAATLGMATRFHVHRRHKRVLSALKDTLVQRGMDEL